MLKEASIPTGSNEQHIRGAGSEQVVGSNSTPTCTEQLGIYVGEGMTPVPKKLAKKIWRAQGKSEDGAAGSAMALTCRKRQVRNVNTWVQGFVVYTSILSLNRLEQYRKAWHSSQIGGWCLKDLNRISFYTHSLI